jgi:hypothetical protein
MADARDRDTVLVSMHFRYERLWERMPKLVGQCSQNRRQICRVDWMWTADHHRDFEQSSSKRGILGRQGAGVEDDSKEAVGVFLVGVVGTWSWYQISEPLVSPELFEREHKVNHCDAR